MQIIKDIEQRSDEWFAVRLGKFTASDALTIANQGKGLETLALEKATEELSRKKSGSNYMNEAIQHGIETEDEARDIYELESGNTVEQVCFVIDNENVGCSPDGLIGEDGLVEIKCPTDKVYMQYLIDDVVKKEYYYQMQMQMLVTNRHWCDYVVYNYNFKKPIIIKRIKPDEEVMTKIAEGLMIGIEKKNEFMKKAMEKINVK